VRRICEEMGEPLQVHNYDRFTALEVGRLQKKGGRSAAAGGTRARACAVMEACAARAMGGGPCCPVLGWGVRL
jgi:hypothetical protein